MYRDPFRGGDNVLVLCETFKWTDDTFSAKEPTETNFRHYANKILEQSKADDPWFGI